MKKLLLIGSLLSITLFLKGQTQKEANSTWEFGSSGCVKFNNSDKIDDHVYGKWVGSVEGTATYTMPNGGVFYSDGKVLRTSHNKQLANDLKGHASSTQSALFVAQPGNKRYIYLFTLDEDGGGLYYSKIDTTRSGLFVPGKKNVWLRDNNAEKLTACYAANNKDVWIIVHGAGNNSFYVYSLTSGGLNLVPKEYKIGSTHGYGAGTKGYMRISPNRKKLALAVVGAQFTGATKAGFVEIFDFDKATGKISNPITIGKTNSTLPTFLLDKSLNGAYGLEFSPNSRFIYLNMYSWGSNNRMLIQFDLYVGNTGKALTDSAVELYRSPNERDHSALLLGNDGRIYLSRQYKTKNIKYFGVINNPNCKGLACNYINDGQKFKYGLAKYGLPNFVKPFEEENKIVFNVKGENYSKCIGDSVYVFLKNNRINLTYWALENENNKDTVWGRDTLRIKIKNNLFYKVKAVIGSNLNACIQEEQVQDSIQLFKNEHDVNDISICQLDSQEIKITPTANYSVIWNDGFKGFNRWIQSSDGWLAFESNYEGCIAKDTIEVTELPIPELELGKDSILCPSDSLLIGIEGEEGLNYSWNDGVSDSLRWVKNRGIFKLEVDNGKCKNQDSIAIDYLDDQRINFQPDTSICRGDSIKIGVYGLQGVNYSWNNMATDSVIHIRDAGFYKVTFTKEHCSWSDSMNLELNEYPTVDLGKDTVYLCMGDSLVFNVNSPIANEYLWQDGCEEAEYTAKNQGLYSVQLKNKGCVAFDSMQLLIEHIPGYLLPKDTSMCFGDSVQLINGFISKDYRVKWNGEKAELDKYFKTFGIKRLEVTSPNLACVYKDSTLINVDTLEALNLPEDTFYCEGSILKLKLEPFSSNADYQWRNNNGEVVGLSNEFEITDFTGKLKVIANKGVCSYIDSTMIQRVMIPELSLGDDKLLCGKETLSFELSNLYENVLWNDGDISFDKNINTSGEYAVIAYLKGCDVRDTINVEQLLFPKLKGTNTRDTTLCAFNNLTTLVESNINHIEWRDGYGGEVREINKSGLYHIVSENRCGIDSIEFEVNMDSSYCFKDIFIANAFSPNGNGINDVFPNLSSYVQVLNLEIYDRWGGKIYSGGLKSNSSSNWDGTYASKACLEGVYTYLLHYQLKGNTYNQVYFKKGQVTLLK